MPFIANTYQPIDPPDFPAVAGTSIRAAQYNSQIEDMVEAINSLLQRNGSVPMQGNLNMGGYLATNLGKPDGNTQAVRLQELRSGVYYYGVATSDVAYKLTVTIDSFSTYSAGAFYFIKLPALSWDSSLSFTLNINAQGEKAVNLAGYIGAFKEGDVLLLSYTGSAFVVLGATCNTPIKGFPSWKATTYARGDVVSSGTDLFICTPPDSGLSINSTIDPIYSIAEGWSFYNRTPAVDFPAWSNLVNYPAGAIVTYGSPKQWFRRLQNLTGASVDVPTNDGVFWELVVTGGSGGTMPVISTWVSGTYAIGSIVIGSNSYLYQCIAARTPSDTINPVSDTVGWKLLAVKEARHTTAKTGQNLINSDSSSFSGTGLNNTGMGSTSIQSLTTGSSNSCYGNGAGSNLTTGNNNTLVGAAAGSQVTTGSHNTLIGARAGLSSSTTNESIVVGYSSSAAVSYADKLVVIGNDAAAQANAEASVVIGYRAANRYSGAAGCVAIGAYAMELAQTASSSTAIGYQSLKNLTTGTSNTALGYGAGQWVTTGTSNTIVGNAAGTPQGSYNTLIGAAINTPSSGTHSNNTCVGAGILYTGGSDNVLIGYTVNNGSGSDNTVIGKSAGSYWATSSLNTILGSGAGGGLTSGGSNTFVGKSAGSYIDTGELNTFIGSNAGYSSSNALSYCTLLGSGSNATGNAQLQLGDASTTSYAYGAVQNRSDIRDKADIRDTVLGLNFILKLRPRDYRWDMRDDYRPSSDTIPKKPAEGASEEELAAYETAKQAWLDSCSLSNIVHDGSKKRTRYHHGLIAQEVQEVLEAENIDFGGYQDHSLKGGQDVKSIGYEELIAPLIKAVQEQQAMIKTLQEQVLALQGAAS